ncbi:MAG: apolipoprotein N-acyltransferase [Sandaracinaceae bacterium]
MRAGSSALRSGVWAAAGGALIGLGGAPIEWSFTAFLAPAALLVALEPVPEHAVGSRRAFATGLVMGTVTQAIAMYWIVGLLMEYGHFPWIAALAVGALLWLGQALAYGVGALLAAGLMRRGAPGWLAVPACLTLAATLSPAIFPWRYGLSQLPFLPFAQVADLGSLPLLDWLVATVACGLLDLGRHRRWRAGVAAAACVVLPLVYGAVRLDQVVAERQRAPRLRVGVVQPNVSVRDKHDPALFYSQLRSMRAMTAALETEGAELVVWPETAYRFPIHRDLARDRAGALGLRQEGVRGPLLVGVLSTDGPMMTAYARDALGRPVARFDRGVGERFNSAMAVDREGRVVGVVDKVHLLAFGETTPLWDTLPFLQRFPRGLTPGRGPQQVELSGARIAVLNCYEDLLADFVRMQARAGPDLLINITNNAWFGDTTAPHLHHMNGRIRAIETRRDLVRVVNTGVSGHTAATGEDLHRTDSFVRARFVADARRLSGTTLWVRVGDWVSPVLGGAMFAFVWARRRRRFGESAPA